MKNLFALLLFVSVITAHRGAQSESCAPYYVTDLSTCDLGLAQLTDGVTFTQLDLSQPITYAATLCYTPTGIWIEGQFVPAGPIATILTLANGRHVSIEWTANAIDLKDQSPRECHSNQDFPCTSLYSVGRYVHSIQ
jgi:hypothetical protein